MIFPEKESPLVKWAGGKQRELTVLSDHFPSFFDCYYEPFFGGGAVFFALQPEKAVINDTCEELMLLYRCIAQQDKTLFHFLDSLFTIWEDLETIVLTLVNRCSFRPFSAFSFVSYFFEVGGPVLFQLEFLLPGAKEMFEMLLVKEGKRRGDDFADVFWKEEREPKEHLVETTLKTVFYTTIRKFLNEQRKQFAPGVAAGLFFFIRELCYSSMFRYNRKGEFNIPYGGYCYNRKNMRVKLDRMKTPKIQQLFARTELYCDDFEYLLRVRQPPNGRDFLFLDPPYDSAFSTYAQQPFTLNDHKRLAKYLHTVCPCRFLLVVKETPEIAALYNYPDVTVSRFEKTYQVNIQSRNEREAIHLLITNY